MSDYRPKLLDTSTWKATLTGEGKLCAVRKEVISDVAVEAGKLNFILSTAAIDRHGDTVAQTGWKLDNYKMNPVVLFGHDQASPPVGKAPYVAVEGEKLIARGVEFTPKDLSPFGWMIGEMYRKGFMNAVSVGFLPGKFKFAEGRGEMAIDFEEQELLEFSAVPVPANPQALQGAKAAGIEVAPLIEWAEKILDTTDGTQTVQRGMAERVWTSLNTRKNFIMQKQEPTMPDEQDVEAPEVEVELPGGMAALIDLLNNLMGEVKMCRKEMVQLVEKMGAYSMQMDAMKPPEEKPMVEEPVKASGEVVAKKVQAEVKRRIASLLGRVD